MEENRKEGCGNKETLIDRLLSGQPDEKEVVKLGIDICKSLESSHRKNIAFGDIRPQNIFISEDGDYELWNPGADGDADEQTSQSAVAGSDRYMAPEVFRGEEYDSAADIYSLGMVMYSLLNDNRGPFLPEPPAIVTESDEEQARERIFSGEELPAPRGAGRMLGFIVKKACDADPAKRYRTAEQMRRNLESYLANYDSYSGTNDGEAPTGIEKGLEGLGGAPCADPRKVPTEDQRRCKEPVKSPYIAPDPPKPGPTPRWKKIVPAVVVVLAVLLVAAGIVFMVLRSNPKEEISPIRVSDKTTGVQVLSSDWDYDSQSVEAGSGLIHVDDILLVKNDSEYPIVGIGFVVNDESGGPIGNASESGGPFTAYGYIPAGGEGIMVSQAVVKQKYKHDDRSYQIGFIMINESMGDYKVPQGSIINFAKEGDYYDISITNSNDTEVSADSIVVTTEFKDGKVFDADATGKLNAPIAAHSEGYQQKAAFVDPHFYARPLYENKTVYILDTSKYGLSEMEITG